MTKLNETPPALSVEALARRWNVSSRHIRRLIDAGQLPQPIHVGNRIRRWPFRVIADLEAAGGVEPKRGGAAS